MRIVIEKKDGSLGVEEVQFDFLAKTDDIRQLREEIQILKAMVMRTPLRTENAAVEQPVEIEARHPIFIRGGKSVSSPQELTGLSKQIYDAVLDGCDTRPKIDKRLNNHISIGPRLSDLCRMGFLVKQGKRRHFVYSRGLDGKIEVAKVKKKAFRKKPFGMALKVYECVKMGVNDSKAISKKLGCKIAVAAASLLSLYERGYVGRRQSNRKFKAYEYVPIVDFSSSNGKKEEKVFESKTETVAVNPYESAVRGLAKNLGIMLPDATVKELSKDANWEKILKTAKNEGNYYLDLNSVGYFRKRLFQAVEEPKVIVKGKELRFACPYVMVKVLGNDASDLVLRFIKEKEDAQVTYKEWAQFVNGLEPADITSTWLWFTSNARWIVKQALKETAIVKYDVRENLLKWVS